MYNINKWVAKRGEDMKMREKWGRALFVGIFALGILWFCMPILHGGFAEGSIFGVTVCALGMAIALQYKKMVTKGGWRKVLARLALGFYILGIGWAGYLTMLIVSYQAASPPPGRNVIVLGAQVYSAERMGVSLKNRVDRAAGYLMKNQDSKCIVTGGQGGNEPCAESLTARNALVRLGIEPERIFFEDKSRNTRENLEYAMEVSQANGIGTEVVVVSQSFHLYRAVRLAESAGFTASGLAAETDPIIYPSYYGRELLSLTKWYIEELLFHRG